MTTKEAIRGFEEWYLPHFLEHKPQEVIETVDMELPDEMIEHILEFCDVPSLVRVRYI